MESFAAIPSITVLCFWVAEACKILLGGGVNRHIPLICGGTGLALGIASHLLMPGYLPAENMMVAACIGAVSGWAATGIDQSVRQEIKR